MAGPVLPDGMTEQQFALLNEDERAGALELAQEEREIKGLADVEDDVDEPDVETANAEEAAAAAAAAAAAPVVADGEPDKTASATTAPPVVAAEPVARTATQAPVSFPAWTAPADIDDQIKGAKAEKRSLRQKFEDGDLTGAEYDTQLEALDEKLETLHSTKMKADLSWETRTHNWVNRDVAGFLAAHTEYKPGSIRYKALDDRLASLQRALPEGADTLDPALLAQAHAAVEEELGPAPGAKPKPKTTDDPRNKRPDPPPSLGSIPAADLEETESGEFAYMDKLSGTDFEAAMAKMSPAQRDRYLEQGT